MVSGTKQVPRKRVVETFQIRGFKFRIVEVPSWMLFPEVFPEVHGAKRQYPGAEEGSFLAGYLNRISARPQKLRAFCRLLFPLMKFERGAFSLRGLHRVYVTLTKKIDRQGSAHPIPTQDGLVIPPASDEGKAALAAVLLYRQFRLSCIRQCLHCGTWFYAHLERQRFCGNRAKRCQWKHYHSPGWRKRNRERNRKHQRAYRERLFGKRR